MRGSLFCPDLRSHANFYPKSLLRQVAAILEALGGESAPASRDGGAAGAPAEGSSAERADGGSDARGGPAHCRRGWALLADHLGREELVEAERRFLTAALELLQARQ